MLKTLILILISSALVNNVVLGRFLGICPLLGASGKVKKAAGMGTAVTFVTMIASAVTYPIYHFVLAKLNIGYMRTIVFILVIAALVQLLEMILKKLRPVIFSSLGAYLPLITTNCAVLGATIINIDAGYTFAESMVNSLGISIGFLISITIMAGIRERIEDNDIPRSFRGVPIVLVTAGLMAIAFYGFTGLM